MEGRWIQNRNKVALAAFMGCICCVALPFANLAALMSYDLVQVTLWPDLEIIEDRLYARRMVHQTATSSPSSTENRNRTRGKGCATGWDSFQNGSLLLEPPARSSRRSGRANESDILDWSPQAQELQLLRNSGLVHQTWMKALPTPRMPSRWQKHIASWSKWDQICRPSNVGRTSSNTAEGMGGAFSRTLLRVLWSDAALPLLLEQAYADSSIDLLGFPNSHTEHALGDASISNQKTASCVQSRLLSAHRWEQSLQVPVMRGDVARYAAVFVYGGVYADLDVGRRGCASGALLSLGQNDPNDQIQLTTQSELLLTWMRGSSWFSGSSRAQWGINQDFMAAPRGTPSMARLLRKLPAYVAATRWLVPLSRHLAVFPATGPFFVQWMATTKRLACLNVRRVPDRHDRSGALRTSTEPPLGATLDASSNASSILGPESSDYVEQSMELLLNSEPVTLSMVPKELLPALHVCQAVIQQNGGSAEIKPGQQATTYDGQQVCLHIMRGALQAAHAHGQRIAEWNSHDMLLGDRPTVTRQEVREEGLECGPHDAIALLPQPLVDGRSYESMVKHGVGKSWQQSSRQEWTIAVLVLALYGLSGASVAAGAMGMALRCSKVRHAIMESAGASSKQIQPACGKISNVNLMVFTRATVASGRYGDFSKSPGFLQPDQITDSWGSDPECSSARHRYLGERLSSSGSDEDFETQA